MIGLGRRSVAGALAAAIALVTGLVGPALASNDPFFELQWALEQIGAPEAWARTTGRGVTIGIVDTGIDIGHPDLAGKIVATADCVGQPCAIGLGQDAHGHGTVVSGIAAAVTNNGLGVAGTAPDARLVVAKVLDSTGEGRASDIINGIRWVVDQGARVVNLSLGDPRLSMTSDIGSPLRSGIDYAWSRGAVPVLASGNYGGLGAGNYSGLNALVVGATGRSGTVPSYSSPVTTAKWGLVAPGGAGGGGADVNILATHLRAGGGSGYATAAGTSMAAPHVSGAVALLLAQGLAPAAAVNRLLSTLDRSRPCGAGCLGRLDVGAATGSAPSTTPVPVGQVASVPATAPPTTAAPAATPTTVTAPPTSAPPASSTTAPTAPAPPPSPTPPAPADSTQLAGPVPVVAGADRAVRNPVVVATAAVLLVAAAGSVGTVGIGRLRT